MPLCPLPAGKLRDSTATSSAISFVGPYNPIVVNTGQKLILIDTGTARPPSMRPRGRAQFLTNAASAGIDRKAIDAVIVSHFHGDHMNGLLRADNSLTFPNAEILVPAAEMKFWMDDGEMSRAPKGRMEGLFKNVRRVLQAEVMKRLRAYEEGKEVLPGITAVGTHGHSAGHNSHIVASGSKQVFVQADVTHVPFLFARNPGWHAFYDQDPVMAEATRRKIYGMLVAERMMVQAFHYPFRRWPTSKRVGPAIAKSRCRGIRPSERTTRDTGRPSAVCLRLAQMTALATAARRGDRFRLVPRSVDGRAAAGLYGRPCP